MQQLPEFKSVVILGAGPAGLAVGRDLACQGIDFLILEKGPTAGDSFTRFPTNIYLGPWMNNLLPGSKVGWSWMLRRSTPSAYAYYLAQYAQRNHLPVLTDTQVLAVSKDGSLFAVETSRGRIAADLVVNTTGYFSKPFTPDYPGLNETRVPRIHVCEYRNADSVRRLVKNNRARVLIVGKRLSAGETMCELHRAGFQVDLSFRGALKFGPSSVKEALLSPFNALVEKIQVTLQVKMDSFPPMAGGESEDLINSGAVDTRPDISHFSDTEVFFAGRSGGQKYDLVIFATGYRPALDHLSPLMGTAEPDLVNMESVRWQGLFFAGLDNQQTYRSRFLRGIRRDARILADLVIDRVRSLPPRSLPTSMKTVAIPEEVTIDLDPTDFAGLPGGTSAV